VRLEALADLGDVAELGEDEAADGVEVVVLVKTCRVAPGGCPPGAPTDPYVRD
jgi:hypothetical protein